jgi:hypothetical protein
VPASHLPKRGLLVLLAAVAVALSACRHEGGDGIEPAAPGSDAAPDASGSAGDEPTTATLAGVWRIGESERLVWFGEDGGFAIDDRGRLDTQPAAAGTYTLDGATILFESRGSDLCVEGDTWAFTATLPDDGRLETEVVEDAEGACRLGVGARWTLVRVSPASPDTAAITADEPEGEPATPDVSNLEGIWLLEGTGRLLRFGRDGTYALDARGRIADEPEDSGSFEVDDRGGITFTSGPASTACGAGDRWVWDDVRVEVGPTETDAAGLALPADWMLRGSIAGDDCGHAVDDGWTWIRLSP